MASSSNGKLDQKIGDLFVNKEEVQPILDSWSVEAATTFLKGANFLSAPVVSRKTGEYIGFIDVVDLMLYACGIADAFMKSDQTLEQMKELEVKWASKKISDLVGLNEDNLMWALSPETTLSKIVETMHKGIHRVLIGNKYIVTQTDVVRYLITAHTHKEFDLGDKLTKKISDLKDLGSKPLGFKTSDQALTAFATMGQKKISCVAIVDKDGKIAGNLSASDIRGLTPDLYPSLLLSVSKYLETTHKLPHLPVQPQKVETITESATIADVLKTFSATRLHRLYVVDSDSKPLRVITLTDILQLFCDQGC